MAFGYGVTGIKYEKYEEFKDSYSKVVYSTAFRKMEDLILRNISITENGQMGKLGYRYNELPNILTFIGDRGSGKTSAMLSFMECLKDYHKIQNKVDEETAFYLFENKNVLFTCLDCIDGSLLEKGEDIFKLVLAQMYQKFLDFSKKMYYEHSWNKNGEGESGYQKRELQEKFEKIYKSICTLEEVSSGKIHSGESYMSSLKTLASSQKIREKFEELVKEYLFFVRQEERSISRTKDSEHFLVITVDDIDLNVQNGFQMLEKIHRYLMVPNIVVLLAVDYEQILAISKKNFFKILPKVNKALDEGMNHVHEVSTDYLDKVLPINYRIYMPNVTYSYSHNGGKKELLRKILGVSGVAFDSQGLKLHFYEQKSIRNASNLQITLEIMKPLCAGDVDTIWTIGNKKIDKVWQTCEVNHHWLESDLKTRMMLGKVEKEANKEFLKKVMRENLRRSIERVVEFYNAAIGNDRNRIIESQEYTYGKLLNTMYDLGRIRNGYYKYLVHCLLAYYSYEFTHLYIREKLDGNKIMSGEFLKIISKSIAGNWAEEMIPEIIIKPDEKGDTLTENALHMGGELKGSIALDQRSSKSLNQLINISFQKDTVPGNDTSDYIKKRVYEVEIIFMSIIISKSYGSDFNRYKVKLEDRIAQRIPDIEVRPIVYIEDNERGEIFGIEGVFNIFGFIENSVRWKEELAFFENNLVDKLKEHYGLEKINVTGLLADRYRKWEKKYNDNLPLPVYWFDMTYNIMKRVRRHAKDNFKAVEKGKLFRYIVSVYKDIEKQLSEQEAFYKENRQNSIRFAEKFRECPYVDYFMNEENVQEKEKLFEELADKIILNASYNGDF